MCFKAVVSLANSLILSKITEGLGLVYSGLSNGRAHCTARRAAKSDITSRLLLSGVLRHHRHRLSNSHKPAGPISFYRSTLHSFTNGSELVTLENNKRH